MIFGCQLIDLIEIFKTHCKYFVTAPFNPIYGQLIANTMDCSSLVHIILCQPNAHCFAG